MPKLTKKRVESIKPTDRDSFQWDDELRGFGVRVKASGARSYVIQYRNRHGRSRRLTIGAHGRLTPRKPGCAGDREGWRQDRRNLCGINAMTPYLNLPSGSTFADCSHHKTPL